MVDLKEKFMFDLSFDEPDLDEQEDDLPPPPPTFSEEELEEAKKTAYDEGFQAGETQGRTKTAEEYEQSLAAQTSAALEGVGAQIEEMRMGLIRLQDTLQARARDVVHAAISALYPHLEPKHGTDEIMAMLEEMSTLLRLKSDIYITVHPDLEETIRETLNSHPQIGPLMPNIVLETSSTLGTSDIRLAWGADGQPEGGAERHANEIQTQILALIDQHLGPSQRENIAPTAEDTVKIDAGDEATMSQAETDETSTNTEETESDTQPTGEDNG